MEWLIGAYLAIGVIKAIAKVSDSDPTEKPIWMYAQSNSLKWALLFAVYVLIWPLAATRGSKNKGGAR